MIPVVNALSAGASFVRGNAGAYADVTVYDANGVRLGGATAGSTGIYNISLNRALVAAKLLRLKLRNLEKFLDLLKLRLQVKKQKLLLK